MIPTAIAHAPDAPIQKEVLRDKIAAVLKGWILEGTFRPGDRLPEVTLAARLKVSRGPLREALWLLARQGVVRLQPHHGATVTRLSTDEILEIFEVREVLEVLAARRAHRALEERGKGRLQEALGELEAAARKRDMRRFSEADFRFHQTIWELAGNRHLKEMLDDVCTRFFGYQLIRDVPRSERFRFDQIARDHRKLADAVVAGGERDIEQAFRRSFAEHLPYVLARFEGSER